MPVAVSGTAMEVMQGQTLVVHFVPATSKSQVISKIQTCHPY